MRRTLALLVLALLTVSAVACGGDDDPVDAGVEPPKAGQPAISVVVGGGYVPFGVDFAAVPTVVQPDGTTFLGGAITLQYPGPAVLPVLSGRMDEASVERLLRHAEDAGLAAAELDGGQPGVTDMPTTTITVVLDGVVHTHGIYALDHGLGAELDAGLTDAQRAVRQHLADFVGEVRDLATAAATEPFVPSAYQVLASGSEPAAAVTEEPRPNELAWPFADLPLDEGSCTDVPAARAGAFAAALTGATANTVWRDAAGATWHLSVRAVLPGDQPCTNPDRAAS